MARRNRFAQQAALEALLRFGPEISGMNQIQADAEMQYGQDVRAARGTGRAIRSAVAEARPDVRRIFSGADRTIADANAVTGALPEGVPASIAAAIAQEQSGLKSRMAESRATALTDLADRGVAATEGQAFAVQQARTDLGKTLQQLYNRRLDVGRESGAFTALTARQLRQDAQDRADKLFIAQGGWTQSERNSLRSAGIDPNTGKAIPGGKLDPKAKGNNGAGWASQEQHAAAQDAIQEAAHWAQRLKEHGASRAAVARALLEGAGGKPVYEVVDDGRGGKKRQPVLNPDGTPKTTPKVPQVKSQLLLSAALDQIFDGHLSRLNARRLHARRLRIQDLPLTTYTEWLRQQRRRPAPRAPLAPAGVGGQMRPT
jgi:hypothetical protein